MSTSSWADEVPKRVSRKRWAADARQRIVPARERVGQLCRLLSGRTPEPGLDWPALAGLARRHTLCPVLFHLLRAQRAVVPDDVWHLLQRDYYAAVAASSVRERQLNTVLDTLSQADVPVVLLKGAALARTLYPEPALRSMGDLDFWIPRASLDRARRALALLGYMAECNPERPLALQDQYLGETQLVNQDAGALLVELHWNAFAGEWVRHTTQVDEAAVWERAVPIPGMAIRQMAPEDALLSTALHLAVNHQMGGPGLRTMLDLALMCEKWQINWSLVAHRARAWRIAVATWLVLDVLVALFPMGLPDVPWHLLIPGRHRRWVLRRFASEALLPGGRDLGRGPTKLLYLLLLVDRPSSACRLCWRALFPEADWIVHRYGLEDRPLWRVWLQRTWHPVRMVVHGDV